MWITRLSFPSSSSTLLLQLLVLLWTQTPVPPARACQEEDMPNQVILDWFRQRVLDGLGLDKAPLLVPLDPEVGRQRPEAGHSQRRSFRVGRAAWAHHHQRQHQENTQVILFPSTGEKLIVPNVGFYVSSLFPRYQGCLTPIAYPGDIRLSL